MPSRNPVDAARPAARAPAAAQALRIDVWSDIACPWCWLGKHHLQEALQRTGIEAEVRFHSFELQPKAKGVRPVQEYLVDRYGHAMTEAQDRMTQLGASVGIDYDFERQLAVNTFDAHRVHHLAESHGLGEKMMERLMRAQHGEGADTSDHDTLRRLAAEVGLDTKEVDDVLTSDRFAKDVRRDEALAAQHGIGGVPFFLFDGRLGVSGAQPVKVFEDALGQARAAPDVKPGQ